jgi:1-acyl-sn-glycerol-3-phosphate acyltransferase
MSPTEPLLSIRPEPARTGRRITPALGRWLLRAMGWRIEGEMPKLPKLVIIVAPHTSAWDFPVGVGVMFALDFRVVFLGKGSLFFFPLGFIMRGLGGIPVDRSASHGVVTELIKRLEHSDRLNLVLTPEGTRSHVEHWRTGFYYIAHGAKVPILPVAFDWESRAVKFGLPFVTTGDLEKDIQQLQGFFAGVRGRHARESR